jgi:hypothetical protein
MKSRVGGARAGEISNQPSNHGMETEDTSVMVMDGNRFVG